MGFITFFLVLMLSACGKADKSILGFWKQQQSKQEQRNRFGFQYFQIEKKGDDHLLTLYNYSSVDGSLEFKRREYAVTIEGHTLIIGALGINGIYNESNNSLVLTGENIFIKVDDATALKAIETEEKYIKKSQDEFDCRALQIEVEIKASQLGVYRNQILEDKAKEEWNAFVMSVKNRKPKRCRLQYARMIL